MMKKEIRNLISKVDKRQLRNNTQRVLFALLTSDQEWVSRTSIRVPSLGARLRDLRKSRFGGFKVECVQSMEKAGRSTRSNTSSRQTFYRLDPSTVTTQRVTRALEGVITTSTK